MVIGPDSLYQAQSESSAGLGCSQFAASRELTGEFAGCPLAERSVRTTLIVFFPPGMNDLFCIDQRFEPVRIQAFISKGTIERFDESIVGRLAWAREVDLHPVLKRP